MTKTPVPKDPMRSVEADRRRRLGRQESRRRTPRVSRSRREPTGARDDRHARSPSVRRRPRADLRPARPRRRARSRPTPSRASGAAAAEADAADAREAAQRAAAYVAAELRREARARRAAARCCRRSSASRCSSACGRWSRMTSPQLPSPAKTFHVGGRRCSAIRSTARGRTTRASAGTSWRRCSASASASASPRWSAFRWASSSAASASRNAMAAPIISLLRPVSPLAWLPIGLMVFKAANPAAIWVIFISSIWPMVINTAVGVQRVPQDYLNVARVLNLSEWKVMTRILFPAVLPYMLTGVRLAIGVAWLVIVAAEMLTGGVGIGFWVWDEWNNLNVEHIIIAIFVVGIVGLLLEQLLLLLGAPLQLRVTRPTMTDAYTAVPRPHTQVPVGHRPSTCTSKSVGHDVRDQARAVRRAARHRPVGAEGRVRRADRPFRLRQVDAAQPGRRPARSRRPACCCAPAARSRARVPIAPSCSRTTRCCRGSRASTTCISPSSACSARPRRRRT